MANWVTLNDGRGAFRLNLDQAISIQADNGGGTKIIFPVTSTSSGNLSFVREDVETVWALARRERGQSNA